MRDFKRLRVWKQAHLLSLAVNEHFVLARRRGFSHVARQAQRCASSVPSNIVEGCGHDSPREFARYLQQALASASELEYHLLEAHGFRLVDGALHDRFADQARQVQRQLQVLIERVRRDQH